MPASTFEVPKGTKLEIVYWTIRTSSFSVSFQPDSGGQPQLLVSEINSETTVGESGEFIPFLLIKESGVLTMTTTGGTVNLQLPIARITLSASPYFMARFVLSGIGPQSTDVQVLVTEATP